MLDTRRVFRTVLYATNYKATGDECRDMPEDIRLTDAEEGKNVVTPDGDEIGRITGVHDNVAAVKPDSGLTDRIRSTLGWKGQGPDTETYRLQAADVDSVTDETVVVHGHFEE